MAPRDAENNAYAKFWGDKQRALWNVMVFLEWSIAISSWLINYSYSKQIFKTLYENHSLLYKLAKYASSL